MFLPADEKLRHRNSSVTLTDDGFGCSYFFLFVLSPDGHNFFSVLCLSVHTLMRCSYQLRK